EVAARHVDGTYDPGDALALLASTGTLRARLFERAMPGRTFVTPNDVEQADVVMHAVYGPDGVKTVGADARTRERMQAYVAELAGRGAAAVVAGCTEFSVLFAGVALALPLVDPMMLLAEEAVRTARE
ncbi:MAG TPA: aspartate/glutamate racemase family protein, partial [Planctomycetota bacterium]|nr:aspartate/glutamate racemase family protein [Planctomycetota bacterium]